MKRLANSLVGQFYGIYPREKPSERDGEREEREREKQENRVEMLLGPKSPFLQDEARVRDASFLLTFPDAPCFPTEGRHKVYEPVNCLTRRRLPLPHERDAHRAKVPGFIQPDATAHHRSRVRRGEWFLPVRCLYEQTGVISRYGMLLKGTRRDTMSTRTLQSVLSTPFTAVFSRTSRLMSSRGVADTTYGQSGIGCLTWRGKFDGFARRSDTHCSSSSRIGATVLDHDEFEGPFVQSSDGFVEREDEDSGGEKDTDSDSDEGSDEDGDERERGYGDYELESRVDEREDSEDESEDAQRYGRDEYEQEFSEDERFEDNEIESEDDEREYGDNVIEREEE